MREMPRVRAILWLLWLGVLVAVHWVLCGSIRGRPLFPIEWSEWTLKRTRYAHNRGRAECLKYFWQHWDQRRREGW